MHDPLRRTIWRPAWPAPRAGYPDAVWPVGFLSNAFAAPESMPSWLGATVEWNPMSAMATVVRELFGNPTRCGLAVGAGRGLLPAGRRAVQAPEPLTGAGGPGTAVAGFVGSAAKSWMNFQTCTGTSS